MPYPKYAVVPVKSVLRYVPEYVHNPEQGFRPIRWIPRELLPPSVDEMYQVAHLVAPIVLPQLECLLPKDYVPVVLVLNLQFVYLPRSAHRNRL